MSRCKSCDRMLAPSTIFRSILVPHPTEAGKTTTKRVEEDFCNRCASQSSMYYVQEEEINVHQELGLEIPEENYGY